MSVLKLENVTKRIGKRIIIDDLSLEVNEGEIFGFLGPNGAGKTTTIRMIAGLSSITSGGISICGKSIQTDFEACMKNLGAIIEDPGLYPYMTGYQNLEYFAKLNHVDQKKIVETAKQVGMEGRLKDKVSTYSMGMRQRLGLAQALLHNPKLLILDEPTNGLDPVGLHELRSHLRYLAGQGMTVFVSSHVLSEMQQMCDRVGIIVEGRLKSVMDIGTINQIDQGREKVSISVDKAAEAAMLLKTQMGLEAEINGFVLTVVTERENIPQVTGLLAGVGLMILNVTSTPEKSLEDIFIELTDRSVGENGRVS